MGIALTEQAKIVWAIEPKNYTGAAVAGDYVSMKNYSHATIIIIGGAHAGGVPAVTLEQALTVAGGSSKALGFDNYWHGIGLTTDDMTKVAVVSDTFNLTDAANKIYAIEVEASALDVLGGFDCLTVKIASPGANADIYGALYVLSGARNQGATPPSAIID